MKVSIEFSGDSSVGLFPYKFGMEIPEQFAGDSDDPDYIKYREETRKEIKKLYELMDGEDKCTVWFEDELDEALDSDL